MLQTTSRGASAAGAPLAPAAPLAVGHEGATKDRDPGALPSSASRHGVLRSQAGAGSFELSRLPPSEDLAFFVERHWIVRWDLRGREPYPQATLSHPCVNLVVEAERAAVHGVSTRRFDILLEGEGLVVGTKFRPGAFFPFVGSPVHELTDRSSPLDEIFGEAGAALARAVRAERDVRAQVAHMEAFLRARLPERDPNVLTVVRVASLALEDRSITTVDELSARAGVPARTLQRLFRRYVGVGPKWVIQRYRLHEAVSRAEEGAAVDWSALAQDLGYCDQAHFIKDFKAAVGCAPAEHAASCARLAGSDPGAR